MNITRIERERILLRKIEERDRKIETLRPRVKKAVTQAYCIGCIVGIVCGIIYSTLFLIYSTLF